jgi:hypothetical protein
MLDMNIENQIRSRARIVATERVAKFERDYGAMISDFSKRGTSQSSGCAQYVAQLFGDRLREFGQIMVDAAKEICEAHGIEGEPDLETDLIGFMHQDLGSEHGNLKGIMFERVPFIGRAGHNILASFHDIGTSNLLSALQMSKDRVISDVKLNIIKLRNMRPDNASGPSFNVNAQNVVLAQGNTNSTFHVSQNASQIGNLLNKLSKKIEQAPDVAGLDKSGLLEYAALLSEESYNQKQRPGIVRMALRELGSGLRTVASIPGAYESVRQIAGLFGHPDLLPPLA